MNRMLIAGGLLCSVLVMTSCGDPYVKLMKDQGYTATNPPRAAFGTGTVFRVVDGKEVFVASPDDCFPGLAVTENPVVLLNSTRTVSFDASAKATYTPVPTEQVGAAFGFNKVSKVEVTVGAVTGNDLTIESFRRYLADRKVSKACFGYLADVGNRFVLGAARTSSMTYHLTGTKDINAKVDPGKLSTALSGSGIVDYKTTADDAFTINQPMYIGYKAFVFRDLGINQTESSEGVIIPASKFRLEPAASVSR